MAKIIIEMDTESKSINTTIDGKQIDGVKDVSLYLEEYGEEKYVSFRAVKTRKDGEIDVRETYSTYASLAENIDVADFIKTKKQEYPY